MDALRVLHVQDKCGLGGAKIQGVQRLLLWWWPAFRDTDVELSLVILRGRNAASASFDEAGIEVTYLDRSKFDPRTITDLTRIIRRGRYGVVHTHGYGSTTMGRVAGARAGVPVVVHEHMVDDAMPGFQSLADRLTSRWTARGIGVSKAVARFLVDERHLREDRVEVVYNSVPDEFFTGRDRVDACARFGLDPSHRHVGIVGRLHPIKGHADFLDAAAAVADARPDVRFVIAGDGALEAELRAHASRGGASDRVVFLGHQDDVPGVVATLDVMVVASLSEGFSLTAAEAMAGGVPVVATNVGGIPEVVDDGESGLLVPPRDPAALAGAISRLLDDDDVRRAFGRRARRVAEERFRIQSTVAAFRRIYGELTGRPSTPSTHRAPQRPSHA